MIFNGLKPRKRNLFGQAVEELGSRIVCGELQPGQLLLESDVCRELGTSRTVVREALKSLSAKGLVDTRTRTGTRVLEATHWNLLDLDVLGWRYAAMPRIQFFRELFELRRMIEPSAAALAAERATKADIEAIARAYADMQSAPHESAAAIDADLRFHRALLAAAHNELLAQMAGVIGAGLLTSFRISSSSFDVFVPQHGEVLEAIRYGRAPAARAAMEKLLVSTREFLERELEEPASAATQ
ncbi:MAG TPA: FadR/GntR family transcriptional regulator [Burkholderiales bacterium]|nr:FadR/GntR family transcriptional regulator [Burkholderiales bacterium]